MDGAAKKSTSFEKLVIQNISNVNDLKNKLNEIIKAGKDYEYDVSNCLKSLLVSGDQDIVLLTVQTISELAKCEEKRQSYADKEFIVPILNLLNKEFSLEKKELFKQCCRALGNLCCDCDVARKAVAEGNGVFILANLLRKMIEEYFTEFNEIITLVCKSLLNFAIGGGEFTKAIVESDAISLLHRILCVELKKSDKNDDLVSTVLLVLSVVNDNDTEFLYDEDLNIAILNVLKGTTNIEISELCLEHLQAQAEHDSVKTMLANEGVAHLVCSRLEQLIQQHDAGEINADESEVEQIIKQACDLLIIILTGDDAMSILYNNAIGEVYLNAVKWLDSPNRHLVTTAVLAIGNFARKDDYCIQMMDDNIFDKLLEMFEKEQSVETACRVPGLQLAVLSALRNLAVPARNKRRAPARAACVLLAALCALQDHQQAYRLLALLRMLVHGQESVAAEVCASVAALRAAGRWGARGCGAGAGGEAPRLLAWAARELRRGPLLANVVHVEDCMTSLVNMVVASHSVMQNEAILALTLLAIECLNRSSTADQPVSNEKDFINYLIKAEIGKHVSVLIETNCAKLPIEEAENLLAFLEITCKRNELSLDYKEAKVPEALHKFADSRKDLSDDLRVCIRNVCRIISDNEKD